MTRKEEIRNAIDELIPIHPSKKGRTYQQLLIANGFKAGVIWADKHPANVWHEASEFPNKALPIIIEIDDDIEPSYEVISIDETDEKFWEYLVSDRDITIWAYVKDLLPKEGKK